MNNPVEHQSLSVTPKKWEIEMNNRIAKHLIAAALTLASVLAMVITQAASAATVSIGYAAAGNTTYDLSGGVYGVGDWAYWQNTLAGGGAPTNRKSSADLIGNMSVVGTGALAGSGSVETSLADFVFDDGTLPVSGGVDNVIGLFNNPTEIAGNGVQVNVTSPTEDAYKIYLWGVVFRGTADLTATVGATSVSDSTSFVAGATRIGGLYTITVDPDFAGQVVNLQLTLAVNGTGNSSNVSIAAVAVPEPGSLALLGLGGLCLLRRRR